MIMNFRDTLANNVAAQILTAITGGAGTGKFEFYEGTMPATPNVAISSQTLLGTLNCSATEATRTDNVITFNTITEDSSADASGTIQFARYIDGDSNAQLDFDVTDNAGAGAIKMNTVDVTITGPMGLSSFTITI